MIPSDHPALVGKTARIRNQRFPKMPKKGDTMWSSRGSGVVYEAARGISRRKYRALQYNRVASDMRASANQTPFYPAAE